MPVAFAKHRPKFRIVFLLTFLRSWCSKNGQNDLLILSPSDMISYPCFQLFSVDRVGSVFKVVLDHDDSRKRTFNFENTSPTRERVVRPRIEEPFAFRQ